MTTGRREAKDAALDALVRAQASHRVTGGLLVQALRLANGTVWHDLLECEVADSRLAQQRLSALESRMMPEARS